jgi:folylpolyglutamate synthase/dihydropteroate synthase
MPRALAYDFVCHRAPLVDLRVPPSGLILLAAQPPKQASYYFTRAQIPRALPENELATQAIAAGLTGKPYPTVKEALQAAKTHAKPKDLVVVCGSVFVVAEV